MEDELTPLLDSDGEQLCYFCLEPCDTESPCPCKQPLHPKCYYQMQQKTKSRRCTICRQPYFKPPPAHFCHLLWTTIVTTVAVIFFASCFAAFIMFSAMMGRFIFVYFDCCGEDDPQEADIWSPIMDSCFFYGLILMLLVMAIFIKLVFVLRT